MKWISSLFAKYWRNVHFAVIVILSFVISLGGSQITSRVSGLAVTVFHYPFFKIKDTITGLYAVDEENRRLHQSLVEVSISFSRLEEIERENQRLRAVLGFEPPASYSLMPVQVISVVGDHIPVAVVINQGIEDSVEINQPLINEQGLIGRVVSVSSNVATVQLLTDPAHRVAARVADSREMGIVKFRPDEGMMLDNLAVQGDVSEDGLIISSGLGGVYPPGLNVGRVISVERPEDEPFCIIRLEPAANFNSLEELFILKAEQP